MKSFLLSFGFLLLSVAIFATSVEPTPKKINTTTSNITWKGYKMIKSHEGTLKLQSGTLQFTDNKLTGGEMVVDMNTLTCTDLEAGKGKERLEGHLKADDFFGVDNHPTAAIKFLKVTPKGNGGEYEIAANVTIKNITKEIKFNATAKNGTATADLKLDRSEFDVKFGSGKFFDNLGDKAINDEFELSVALQF